MGKMQIVDVGCKLSNNIIIIRTTFIDDTYIDTMVYVDGHYKQAITMDIHVHANMNEKHYVVPVEEFMQKVYKQCIIHYMYCVTPSAQQLYHDISNTVYNIVVNSPYMFNKEN